MNAVVNMFYALRASVARPVDASPESEGRESESHRGLVRCTGAVVIALFLASLSSADDSQANLTLDQKRAVNEAREPSPPNSPASTFPAPDDTEPLAASHGQLSPADSAAAIHVPPGFTASVFAAEPDVQNPIDIAWDHHGRMWIAENYTYAKRGVRFRDDLRDRVVVFTDADCDGTPENRTVFLDTLSRLTSVEVGPGPATTPRTVTPSPEQAALTEQASSPERTVNGVWLMCPPQLLFVPDADHDMIPDTAPEVVLDGFEIATQNYHNFANGLRFGPDGWLYGRCGGSCPGRVGVPGTPDVQRVALEGGFWRYHIASQRFEALAHGTTNPWGHDFNEFGEPFFINTVNGHLWHAIHGAHFNRPFTLDPNPMVYATIDQHADHYHFDTGQHWTKSRDGAANDYGGGHAHCGLLIYQESTWPASYRGSLLTLNFHGRRANRENLLRRGGGYVGTHGKDFFLSDDEWFRGMELSAGPDGNVFVLDWSDLGECHEHTGVHRNSGRIYKIAAQRTERELQAAARTREKRMSQLASDEASALIDLVCGDERWFSHQAALRLRELNARGGGSRDAVQTLRAKAGLPRESESPAASPENNYAIDPSQRCRLLWTLDNLGGLTGFEQSSLAGDYATFLADPSEHVRAAAIRSLTQQWPIDDVYGPHQQCEAAWPRIEQNAKTFIEMFEKWGADDSALVRLTLVSTMQRLPADQRTAAAIKLLQLSGTQDINDHNIPKMMWYGVMSRAKTHPDEMVGVASASQIPELTTYLSRSIAEQVETSPNAFNSLIETALLKIKQPAPNANWCQAMFVGIEQGIVGIRRADMPPTWSELKHGIAGTDIATPNLINQLDTLFGEGLSPEEMLATLNDKSVELTTRLNALEGLVASLHEPDHARSLSAHAIIRSARPLVASPHVNLAAAESLATIDDRLVAELLLDNYGRFRAPLRPNVIALLCTRKTFALAIVDRLDKGKLPKDALTASDIRVLTSLGDTDLSRRVETVWGRVRETSQERTAEIERLTELLTPERIRGADRSAGRVLFDSACASCHRMFGNGEQVGPDLTGAQRGNLEYLLSNIVDPDAVVGADYRATKVLTNDGRLLVGLITQRTRRTLTIASATRTETLGLDEIEREFPTDNSPMPSGLLQPLDDEAIANLIAYLLSPVQIQPKQ